MNSCSWSFCRLLVEVEEVVNGQPVEKEPDMAGRRSRLQQSVRCNLLLLKALAGSSFIVLTIQLLSIRFYAAPDGKY